MADSHFVKFIREFYDFKNTIDWKHSYQETRGYGWRMSDSIREEFSNHLEKEWPDASQTLKDNFSYMFVDEHDLVGVQIIGKCSDNKVYLLQATEKTLTFNINDFAIFDKDSIYTPHRLKCPVTNKQFNWPFAIKVGSFLIKDSVREYYDIMDAKKWGVITWDADKSPYIDLYISGKVNYKTGNLLLQRYHKINEDQYDLLLAAQTAPSSQGGSSGSASSTPAVIYKKDKDAITITFTVYDDPVKILWEYDMTS